jgi:formylglycine-generating enzyme required for sulfatase activity
MIRIITFLCAVFWVAAAGAHEPAGAVLKDCDECPEVVVIPAGSFIMGSTAEETVRGGVREQDRTREQPPRRVTIANDLAL